MTDKMSEDGPKKARLKFGIDGLRVLYATSLAASREDTQNLNCVLLRLKDGKVKIAATDKRILAFSEVPVGKWFTEVCGNYELLIPAKSIVELWGQYRNLPTIQLTISDEDQRSVALYDTYGLQHCTWQKRSIAFPVYEDIIPQPGEVQPKAISQLGLSTNYLNLALKVFGLFGVKQLHLELPINPGSPLLLSSKESPVILAIMPVQLDYVDKNPLRINRKLVDEMR
jgi:hypothetical protein